MISNVRRGKAARCWVGMLLVAACAWITSAGQRELLSARMNFGRLDWHASWSRVRECPPGGEAGIRALADLLGRDAKPLNPENGEEKPKTVVVIDEQRCIGCCVYS